MNSENDLARFAVTAAEPVSHITPEEWEGVGEERLITGSIVVFQKGEFLEGSFKTAMPPGGLYLVLSAKQSWVKRESRLPIKHVTYSRMNGPVRDDLGDNDESAWETGPDGKPRDPWALTWYVTIVDAKTGEHLTFTTSTAYGSLAVDELVGQIIAMNRARPRAVPVIRLEACLRPNRQWGKVSAPKLTIVGWRGGVEPAPKPAAPAPRLTVIESRRNPAAAGPIDDDIPF